MWAHNLQVHDWYFGNERDISLSQFLLSSHHYWTHQRLQNCSPETKFNRGFRISWRHSTQWGPLLPKGRNDLGWCWWPPAYPTWNPTTVSFSFLNCSTIYYFWHFFRVLNFWSHFKTLNYIFLEMGANKGHWIMLAIRNLYSLDKYF